MNTRLVWTRMEPEGKRDDKSGIGFENQYGEKLIVFLDRLGLEKYQFMYSFSDLPRFRTLYNKYSAMQADDVIFTGREDLNIQLIMCKVLPERISVIWRLIEAIGSEVDIADIKPQIRAFLGLPNELEQAPVLPINNNAEQLIADLKHTIAVQARLVAEQATEIKELRNQISILQAYNAPPGQQASLSPKLFK